MRHFLFSPEPRRRGRSPHRWLLAGIILLLVGLVAAAPALAQEEESADLSGIVTLNGEVAPDGVGLVFTGSDGVECSRSTTVGDGAYQATLSDECDVGGELTVTIAATGTIAADAITYEGSGQVVNIPFDDLSESALLELGVITAGVEEVVQEQVAEQVTKELTEQGQSALITGVTLVVVLVVAILGGFALLMIMVIRAREEKGKNPDFRFQIEGMVLVMVVLAVIILGVTEKIGQEGLVSVLAAIAGYAAGKQSSTN